MKRTVTITIEIDPTEYDEPDTADDTLDLVEAFMKSEADPPDTATIECGGIKRTVNLW